MVLESVTGLSYSTHAGLSGSVWAQTSGGTNASGTTNADWDTFALTTPTTLVAGTTLSFVVTYDTESTVTGAVVNWAEASAENSTKDPRDPDDTESTRIADLGIVKTHTSPAAGENAVAGESVDYQLVVTNHGPSVSSAPVTVTDTLPAGFSYRAGTALVAVDGAAAVAVDPAAAAIVVSAYALPYALCQPVLGALGDYYGKGRMLSICIWLLVLTFAATVWSPTLGILIAARFVGAVATRPSEHL